MARISQSLGSLGAGTPGFSVQPDMRAAVRLATQVHAKVGSPVRKALAAAHHDMAHRVRQYAAEALRDDKSWRPQIRGNLLEAAILDERNSVVNASGFRVGEEDWLDRSPAMAYWRRIEEGGPNPMAEWGVIHGYFWGPGAGTGPNASGYQGRLAWRVSPNGFGFTIAAVDRAYGGYHMHRTAGRRFVAGRLPLAAYKRAFSAVGLDFHANFVGLGGKRATNKKVIGF